MYFYYELCEKICGGSPATEQIETGVKTKDVNEQVDESQERGSEYGDVEEHQELSQLSDTSTVPSSVESSVSEDQASSSSRKRWEKLDDTLASYKYKRIKKGCLQMPKYYTWQKKIAS